MLAEPFVYIKALKPSKPRAARQKIPETAEIKAKAEALKQHIEKHGHEEIETGIAIFVVLLFIGVLLLILASMFQETEMRTYAIPMSITCFIAAIRFAIWTAYRAYRVSR